MLIKKFSFLFVLALPVCSQVCW